MTHHRIGEGRQVLRDLVIFMSGALAMITLRVVWWYLFGSRPR